MTVYAKNKDAVAICNRSGQKMMRADMVEDGYLRGLLVHPDWYDPYHPQERPFDPDEGIAIYRPAPDLMPVPPGPSLILHTPVSTQGVITVTTSITQPNPPGSTVTRWELWRAQVIFGQQPVFTRITTQLPTPPQFIQPNDLVQAEANNQVPANSVVNASVVGQQFATIVDNTAIAGNSYQYYVITDTADTSNTQSPNQFPNGLQSAPTYVNQLGQTTSAPINNANPATTPKTVVALPTVFLAALGNGTYYYSGDGVAWTQGSFIGSPTVGQMAYGGTTTKLWVIMTNTQTPHTSPDGILWTARTNALPAAGSWQGVCWSPKLNLFVATSNGTNNTAQVATSPDGITWTSRATPSGVLALKHVYWSPRVNLFIAINTLQNNTTLGFTSPDGINWTLRTISASAQCTYFIDPGVNFDLIVFNPGSVTYAVSPDGINWTSKSSTNIGGSNGTPSMFQIGGDTTHVYGQVSLATSPRNIYSQTTLDLTGTWATFATGVLPTGINAQLEEVAYSAALNVSAMFHSAANPSLLVSTQDGVHWNTFSAATTFGFLTIAAAL